MSPRELASHEVQMRQVWNMRQRPALVYVVPDMDGGDDASTLRTALEKGGVFGDAYHKFSSTFLSAFGSTFEKERLWKRKRKKPHRSAAAVPLRRTTSGETAANRCSCRTRVSRRASRPKWCELCDVVFRLCDPPPPRSKKKRASLWQKLLKISADSASRRKSSGSRRTRR